MEKALAFGIAEMEGVGEEREMSSSPCWKILETEGF